MKKRWIAMILCCAVIATAGCGSTPADNNLQTETGSSEEREESETVVPDRSDVAGSTEADVPNAQAEAGSDKKQENPEAAETDGQEKTEQMEVEELEKVSTDGSFDRAAYFLDMTYGSGNPKNTMVSPLSLEMALGLVSGGAEGKTAEELRAYLSNSDYGKFAAEYMQYAEDLNRDYGDSFVGGYKTAFEIANSVWVNDNRKLVSEYEKKAKKDFQAEIASVSFDDKHKSKTAKKINDWCDKKTHGLIPSVISEDALTETLAMILINSLYFEAPWSETWSVSEDKFTDLDGNETTQEMLRDTLAVYYENDYATGFSKYYMNGLEFIGILPKQTGDFEVRDLDIKSLLDSRNTDVDVHALMPKLDFDTTADQIVPILKSQGVEAAFDKNAADFSGLVQMRENENTYISDIIQKCKIELDENGTKAAAVTAMMLECLSAMPMERQEKDVYLNRPFAFMIYDGSHDQILFIGKVVNLK